MLKVACLAAALAVATTAQAVDMASPAGTTPVESPACHSAQDPALGCAERPLDPDVTPQAADLPGFVAAAPPPADWTPLHPPRGADLDFKEAATAPTSMLATLPDAGGRHRLLQALFALGALVVLLRKRPL